MNVADTRRAAIATAAAASALGLAKKDTMLRGRQAKEFYRLFSEAYMALPHDMVEVEVSCTCSDRPWPHHHSPEDAARARRLFIAQAGAM